MCCLRCPFLNAPSEMVPSGPPQKDFFQLLPTGDSHQLPCLAYPPCSLDSAFHQLSSQIPFFFYCQTVKTDELIHTTV